MNRLQRLADMAVSIASEEAVETNEVGFTLNVQDAQLMFFAPNNRNGSRLLPCIDWQFWKQRVPW